MDEHHHSHADVVESLHPRWRGDPGPGFDAVVVPAARSADHLEAAATAARELGAWFIALTSHATGLAAAHRVALEHGPGAARSAIVGVPDLWSTRNWPKGPALEADGAATFQGRRSNTSAKRNAAISLALMCGWQRILFLDDDVLGVTRATGDQLSRVLADGTGWEAAGFVCRDFPDNSVLCHAVREAGGLQDQFIGGGALAVRVGDHTPHFPHLYNEDWLFMLPMLARRKQSILLMGELTQEAFDPFADVEAGRVQERGDVLAEGLFHLLHCARGACDLHEARTEAYWRDVLRRRQALHERVCAVLRSRPPGARIQQVLRVLGVAAEERAGFEASEFSRWVDSWIRDGQTWADFLSDLPRERSIDGALHRLGLRRHLTPLRWSSSDSAARVAYPPVRLDGRRIRLPAGRG